MAVNVVGLFMALLSFAESAPRAYRLKASNAAPPISTSGGTSALSTMVPWLSTAISHAGAAGIPS
jgi:hypothetical protein